MSTDFSHNVQGRTVLGPNLAPDLRIEVLSGPTLVSLGRGAPSAGGCFDIDLAEPATLVDFRWTDGKRSGRSPFLQPFPTDQPIRLHVYDRWCGSPVGSSRFEANVQSTSGRPVVGMAVGLLEVTLRHCQMLGEAQTGADGSVRIRYDREALLDKWKPDLRVVVFDDAGTPLLESRSPQVELPGRYAKTASLFDRIGGALAAEGVLRRGDLCLSPQDITYVAERHGLPADAIAAFAVAAALSVETKIPAEALFALARGGAKDPSEALLDAAASDEVSIHVLDHTEALAEGIRSAGAQQLKTRDLGKGSLDDFLATVLDGDEERERVAEMMFAHRTVPELHDALAECGLGSPELKALNELQAIVGVDVLLAAALKKRACEGTAMPTGEELALLNTKDWSALLAEARPPSEAEDEDRRRLEAVSFKRRAQQLFPEQVFRAQVDRHAGQSAWAKEVAAHLSDEPETTFRTPLPVLGNADGKTAPQGLIAYKRVVDLTGDHGPVGALLDAGFTSAADIAGVSLRELSDRFVEAFDGDTHVIELTHRRAVSKTVALAFAADYLPTGPRPSLCDCTHCRSIFGPAAYLFELLALFRRSATEAGSSLLQELDLRRPDVIRTRLSCANTNIEVPHIDLVNEVLQDKLLAGGPNSDFDGLAEDECLAEHRQSQGTSQERRAEPQNPPHPAVLEVLASAQWPWSLPYHHDRARASSARARLVDRPDDVAWLSWPLRVASGSSTSDATAAIAEATLDLSEAQRRLITTPSPTLEAWGDEVATAVGVAGPTLSSLARMAGTDVVTLESSLDTLFVRGEVGLSLTIEPADFCESGEPPRLSGPADALTEVLDRLHRFERVRRHLEWAANTLDAMLHWLGAHLNETTLQGLGAVRLLQRRLRLEPAEVAVLFIDPSDVPVPTLRRRARASAFASWLGPGASRLNLPDPALEEQPRLDAVLSQIAAAAGEPLSAVDIVFGADLLAPLTSAAGLLDVPVPAAQEAYVRAVSATARLSLWAAGLRIEPAEVISLSSLSGSSVLDSTAPAAERLGAAVELVVLADRVASLPVEVDELAYLVGADAVLAAAHSPSATWIGQAASALRSELAAAREANLPVPSDPRAALRQILARALTIDGPSPDASAAAAQLAKDLEWSAFFTSRAAAVDARLVEFLPEWRGLATVSGDPSAAETTLSDALSDLVGVLADWLSAWPGVTTSLSAGDVMDVGNALGAAVRTALSSGTSDLAALADALSLAVTSAGAPAPAAGSEQAIVDRALVWIDGALADALGRRAQDVFPLVESAIHRRQAERVLVRWLCGHLEVSEVQAQALLQRLSDPADVARPIAHAFIEADGGPAPRLRGSEVRAAYFAVTSGTPGDAPVLERSESTLSFDWSRSSPAPTLGGRPFAAVLEIEIASRATALVVEADGAIELTIDDGSGARVLLDETPGATLGRFEVALPATSATLRVRYQTPPTGGPRTLALSEQHGAAPVEFRWPLISDALARLHRVAVALRGTRLGSVGSEALPPDLDRMSEGAPLSDWLSLFATDDLLRHVRTPDGLPRLLALLDGQSLARADVSDALPLDDDQLAGVLALLEFSDVAADPVVPSVPLSPLRLQATLAVADQARRWRLPVLALARWYDTKPEEAFEHAIAALRRSVDSTDWPLLLAEVHDPVRARLRDAQCDVWIGRDRDATTGTAGVTSYEDISDRLLTDVQMSPCMVTSRVQFAYAAAQRYVEAARAALVPWFGAEDPGEEAFTKRWVSMRQYRLHEAQMRILVHAENWIEPAIRPTKTPAFSRLEETMSSGPLSLSLAESGMRDYAAALAEVARLETLAIVTHEPSGRDRPLAFRDLELYGTHVFARTRANPQRIYYRRRRPAPDRRWTPWELVDADLEGTHYVAAIVFGRLRLMCADFSLARGAQSAGCSGGEERSATSPGDTAYIDYEVSLSWIDREHGQWTTPRRSHRIPFEMEIDMPARSTVFEEGITEELESVKRDATAALKSIDVKIDASMRDDSRILASVFSEGTEVHLGPLENPARETSFPASGLPSGFEAESIDTLRLRLVGSDGNLTSDDPFVESISVRYVEDGTGSLGDGWFEVPRGTLFENLGEGARFGSQDVPFRFFDGFKPEGGSEDEWSVFEAPLPPFTRDRYLSGPGDFDMEIEAIPQTIDLAAAISIQVAQTAERSFSLRLFSVPGPPDQVGRMRPRFRPRPTILRDVPEARETWGEDWVAGREFCYRYETQDRGVLQVDVFSDDTIEAHRLGYMSVGRHRGVVPRGQMLASEGDSVAYGDDEALASPRMPYQLTVGRQALSVHSSLSPKVLDEVQANRGRPARTFLIEKQPGLPVPAAEPVYEYTPPPPELVSAQWRFDIGMVALPVGTSPTPTVPPPTVGSGGGGGSAGAVLRPGLNVGIRDVEEPLDLAIDEDRLRERFEDAIIDRSDREGDLWRFFTFWHPQAVGLRSVLEGQGLPQLVRYENQALAAGTDLRTERLQVDEFERSYGPTRFVHTAYPRDEVDFTVAGPYSEYNWELFFDGLLYLAQRFDEEGQYDDADEIFGLLIDRSAATSPGAWESPALFQTAPIRWAMEIRDAGTGGVVDGDLERFHEEVLAQIERVRSNPYQPHLIARGWPTVYARALRLRYAEHLIEAGEADFRRAYASDNRTELESASLRFDLAARVLGPSEASLPSGLASQAPCFASLVRGDATAAAPGTGALEPWLPASLLDGADASSDAVLAARAHFCTPANDALDALRARVADRLLKLRSCQDIEGVRRALSLYGRRIDPALLVRATAEGLDIDVLLGRLASKKPSLYFQALWQRAMGACERARAFEDSWLGAQGQADAEALTLLQNDQEIRALEAQEEIASQRVEDARRLEEALETTIESAEIRREFYASRKMINAQEQAEGQRLQEAGRADTRAAGESRSASDWAWVPTSEIYADAGATFQPGSPPGPFFRGGVRVNYRLGGETAVKVYQSNAEGHRNDATALRVQAGLMGRQGSFVRRAEDWKLQEDLARKDIAKGGRDLAGAQIRIAIAQMEQNLHRRRIDDARAVRTFLTDKVSSQQMHAWRARRLERLRYRQHELAYDLVSQARAALVREHGLDAQPLVTDPWNASHRGVGAAAELIHELEQQQQLYLETWQRELNKVKVHSLVERDPLAFLELIQRGEAIFSIPEFEYDEDSPGDYFRRLRGVSVDVPAVRGPYTNVNGRLTQLRGEKRLRAHRAGDPTYARDASVDDRFGDDLTTGETIALNSGVQDSGALGPEQGSENPAPFALNGAISTFRLELPIDSNHFERQTITDVILRVGITARAGGVAASQEAVAARQRWLAERPQAVMLPLHSAFSTAWQRFVHGLQRDGEAELVLAFEDSHVPLRLAPTRRIVRSSLYFSVPQGRELSVAAGAPAIGEFDRPPALQPRGNPGDPHVPPPMWRLALREPMVLGREETITVRTTDADAPALRRGWLVCWLEGESG